MYSLTTKKKKKISLKCKLPNLISQTREEMKAKYVHFILKEYIGLDSFDYRCDQIAIEFRLHIYLFVSV